MGRARPTRSFAFSPWFYRQRRLVERFFNRIKQMRGLASRRLPGGFARVSNLSGTAAGQPLPALTVREAARPFSVSRTHAGFLLAKADREGLAGSVDHGLSRHRTGCGRACRPLS